MKKSSEALSAIQDQAAIQKKKLPTGKAAPWIVDHERPDKRVRRGRNQRNSKIAFPAHLRRWLLSS
jgi:hypothetical protein